MHLKRKYKRATPRHSIVRISDTNSHPSTESIVGQIKDVFQKKESENINQNIMIFLTYIYLFYLFLCCSYVLF